MPKNFGSLKATHSLDLPKPIRFALTKALAKKREDRFGSCSEFIDALKGGRASGGRASVHASRARGLRAFILATVAALGLVSVGIWYWQQGSSKPPTPASLTNGGGFAIIQR